MTTPFERDSLPPDTLRRLVEILTHFGRINTIPERQTFLELSGLQSLTPHLHLNETNHQFASELIRESQRVGSFTAGGEPAFYQLLGYLQKEVEGHPQEHEFLAGLRRAATPPVTRADTLQRPSFDFTGRTAEIERLTKALRQGRPVIISGMGGIGKSDLARKVAEVLRAEFPGSALQVELQPDNKPVTATELLGTLILALNPTAKLPETLAERVATLRSLMQGQKGILLLDNAAAHEQIQPLEALWQGWAVLITSRARWVVQGGRLERLNPMDSDDAETLVAILTENYGRVLTEIEVKQVAEACQFHPLALHVASAYLGTFAHHTVVNYIEQVCTAPMSALVAPEYANLAQILGISIEQLYQSDPILSERWHLLALMPDAFDVELAQALLGKLVEETQSRITPLDKITTKATLDGLVRLNLVETISPITENKDVHYRLHDFLTDYALNHSHHRPPQTLKENAIRCHALLVLQRGRMLNDLYLAGSPVEALQKFDALWNHLNIAWRRLSQDNDAIANFIIDNFANWLVYLLDLRLLPHKLIPYQEAALHAAQAMNERSTESVHLISLGLSYVNLGEIHRAIRYYKSALTITREMEDRKGEGGCLGNLGGAYYRTGEVRTAIDHYKQALIIQMEIGDKRGIANQIGNLGLAYAALGQTHEAISHYKQALSITREISDKRNEGIWLSNLGSAYTDLGEVHTAIYYHELALVIDREIGNKRGEGNILGSLGIAYKNLGEIPTAINYYQQSLSLAYETGNKHAMGYNLTNLGIAYQIQGEIRTAINFYEKALIIDREMGDKRGEGIDCWNLALAYEQEGELEQAIIFARVALHLYEETEHPNREMVRNKLQGWGVEDL